MLDKEKLEKIQAIVASPESNVAENYPNRMKMLETLQAIKEQLRVVLESESLLMLKQQQNADKCLNDDLQARREERVLFMDNQKKQIEDLQALERQFALLKEQIKSDAEQREQSSDNDLPLIITEEEIAELCENDAFLSKVINKQEMQAQLTAAEKTLRSAYVENARLQAERDTAVAEIRTQIESANNRNFSAGITRNVH